MSWLDILLQVYEFFFGEILDGFVFDRPVGLLGSLKAMVGFFLIMYFMDLILRAISRLVGFLVQVCWGVFKSVFVAKRVWKTCDFNRPTNKKVL